MTQKRRRCDKQFKIAAARVVLGGEMGAVDLARELGIKDSTLRRWAQEHGGTGENVFPGNDSPKVNKDYEIVKLRKKVEELERASLVEGVRRRGPQQAMGGRHRLHRDGRRTALPRSRDRRIPQEGRGLVDVRAHDREAGRGCARAGGRKGEPSRRLQPRFHDDQGSQHASRAFQRCLESHGIAQSMSRPGGPWDDALAESFFKTLKRELASGKGCKTREEAKQNVFESSSSTATGRGCTHRSAITPMRPRARYCLKKLIFSRPRNLDQPKGWPHSRSKETSASPYPYRLLRPAMTHEWKRDQLESANKDPPARPSAITPFHYPASNA